MNRCIVVSDLGALYRYLVFGVWTKHPLCEGVSRMWSSILSIAKRPVIFWCSGPHNGLGKEKKKEGQRKEKGKKKQETQSGWQGLISVRE
jgi:hypothetical protein